MTSLADRDVAEKAEPRVVGGLLEGLADRLDLRVVRAPHRSAPNPTGWAAFRACRRATSGPRRRPSVGELSTATRRRSNPKGPRRRSRRSMDAFSLSAAGRAQGCASQSQRHGARIGPAGRPETPSWIIPDRTSRDIAALDTTLTTVERVLDVDGLRAGSRSSSTKPRIPSCGTTRPGPRRSPASCPMPRVSCGGSRACGSVSTTCRCSTRWPPRKKSATRSTRPKLTPN